MKIPINWLKEHIDISKSNKEIAQSFTSLGLMQEKPIENNILELEHRMDRADWLSIIGCARDLAAFEKKQLEYPQLYTQEPGKLPKNEKVKIEVKCKNKVNRFNTRIFKNITVMESPLWLKERLEDYGIPSINNIVDVTNYVMIEFGQPMHAQDIQKMEKAEIIIRDAIEGEEITTLLGEKIKLIPEAFVLTQNDKPTVIGGIVGGKATGVDKNTKNIILDAGNYNQSVVRKVSRNLKIQNETVSRYDKFLHPKLTEIAIQRATQLILDLAGGEYYENEDWYPTKWPEKEQKISLSRLRKLSGMDFDIQKVKNILARLEYELISEKENELLYKIPYFRTDVVVEDDLIADVLRINDYKNIPSTTIEASPPRDATSQTYIFEDKLKDVCINLGLNEHITDPLIPKTEENNEIELQNPLSSEKSALRTDIKQTLLPVVKTYQKHSIDKVGIFEIGKIYFKEGNNYIEQRKLQIIYINKNVSVKKSTDELKKIISSILKGLDLKWKDLNRVGQITPTSATFDIQKLMEVSNYKENKYVFKQKITTQIKHKHTQDISLILNYDQKFGKIYSEIINFNKEIIDATVREEHLLENNKKSILIEISFKSSENKEIKNKLLDHLQKNFEVQLRTS